MLDVQGKINSPLLGLSLRRFHSFNFRRPLHVVQEAFLGFMDLIIRECREVVHDGIPSSRCFDLNQAVLLRRFSLPSIPFFDLPFLFLSLLFFPLVLRHVLISLCFSGTVERTFDFFNGVFFLLNRVHIDKLVFKNVHE